MEKRTRVSNKQLQALITTTVIGVGVLSISCEVANVLNNDGWILIVFGGILTIPFIYIMNKLTRMYPGRTFYEFGKEIVGTFLFNIISFIYLCYFLIVMAFEVRIFSEVLKAFLFENTPIEMIIITMLFTTAYIGRSSIEGISRLALIILPIIMITTIVFFILALPSVDYTNILPILRIRFTDVKKIFTGTGSTFFVYIGFEIVLIAMAYVENPEKSFKYSIKGIFYVIIIYLVTFFITISQLGVHELKRQIWPSLTIMKAVDLPGFFIENIDGLILAAWILVIFGTLGPFMYSSGIILSEIFNSKMHNFFILPLVPVVSILALMPQSLSEVYIDIDKILKYLGILTIAIFPSILYIIALLKKGGKR